MNTNFQTIHQMGNAISDFVKQATGRDSVQNIDMDHVTVAQNHVYEEVDISGQAVRFNAGAAGLAFEKLLVQIKPVQEGSGDPSPENVRPITGWTMVNLYRAGQNLEDAQVFRFPFPSEAGVVYGGTLDAVTGELVVDMAMADIGALDWVYSSSAGRSLFTSRNLAGIYKPSGSNNIPTNAIFECYLNVAMATTFKNGEAGLDGSLSSRLVICDNRYSDINSFKTAMTGVKLVYELANPVTYQLTPQEITTLLGQNNIWADTGDIEVKFTNLKELY